MNFPTNIASKIQDKHRYRMFVREVRSGKELFHKLDEFMVQPRNINMFNPSETEEQRFIELITLMGSQECIKKMHKVLIRYYRYTGFDFNVSLPIDSKKFISLWMFASFPETTMGLNIRNEPNIATKKSEYPYDVYFLILNLIEKFKVLTKENPNMNLIYSSEFKRKLCKNVNQYSTAYLYFMGRQRYDLMSELTREYFGVYQNIKFVEQDSNMTQEKKAKLISEFKKSQKKIFIMLRRFDSSISKDDLDLYAQMTEIQIAQTEVLQIQVLTKDITDRKFLFFRLIMEEIKKSLLEFKADTLDLDGANFNDIFDHEIIIQNIMNNMFTINDANTYGNQMKIIINKLQAPAAIQQTNTNWATLVNTFDISMEERLSHILFFIMKEIRNINDNIRNIEAMVSVGINPFVTK